MLAGQHLFILMKKVVNIRPVLHNYPSHSKAGQGITTLFARSCHWGVAFFGKPRPKGSYSYLSERQPTAQSSLIHKRCTFNMSLITQMKEQK